MARRPRTVSDDDRTGPVPEGAGPPKGTEVSRRAKSLLRAAARAAEDEHLDAEQMHEAMKLTRRQVKVLDAIASGLPVRGARDVMAAIRAKLDFSMAKPAMAMDVRAATIELVDCYPPGLYAPVETLTLPPSVEEEGEEP